jgi:hypothetical protein
MTMNKHATIKELLETVFYIWSNPRLHSDLPSTFAVVVNPVPGGITGPPYSWGI